MYTKLAWRNLWRNYRRTLITVTSIMFAVVLALYIASMNRGMHDQMIDNMSRFHTGYLQIQDSLYEEEPSLDNAFYFDEDFGREIQDADSDIEFILPRIETFMLAAGEVQTRGAMVLGVDLEKEHRLNSLKDRLTVGEFFSAGDETVVLAEGLAGRLNLAVGDTLVLLGQGRFGMTAAGKYAIRGLLKHPLGDLNNRMVYISLPDAQWLLSAENHITSLLVTPQQVGETEKVAASLRSTFADDGLRILTWTEMMPELLQAIEFDLIQQYFTVGILYVVIGFGLFGTILMMTLERMREFGVLLSVGMQRTQLGIVLFIETLIISLLGVVSGWFVGYPLIYYFYKNPIPLTGDMAEVIEEMGLGIEAVLSFSMDADIFWTRGMIIFIIAFFICLYPVIKVLRLNILNAVRG